LKYYRLMSGLPALPPTPERPPLPLAELGALLAVELTEQAARLAEALLLRLDVANAQALAENRRELFDDRGTRRLEQLSTRAAADLPDFLEDFLRRQEEGALGGPLFFVPLWQGYYRYLLCVAEEGRSRFLREYVAFELPLLNGLARQRAERLGADVTGMLIEEPSGPSRHDELLARLAEEENPQARERILDAARLQAIEAAAGTDPFSIDAVLAYLAAILVFERWDLPRRADARELLEVFA